MKFRTFIVSLIVVGTILILGGVGGFLGITLQKPLNIVQREALAEPSAAIFVPKQSPLMLSLLVNPDRLFRLRETTATPNHRRQAIAEVDQLKHTLLDPIDVDYQQDIQPWLGNEVTFAVTTPDRDRDLNNGEQPGYLWAIASQDGALAREFMQRFWQKRAIAGANLSFEQYAGVQLIYQQASTAGRPGPSAGPITGPSAGPSAGPSTDANVPWATAIVGNQFLLLANDPMVLRQAITAAQARDLNLAQSPTYRRILDTLVDRSVGLAYINFPTFNQWSGLTAMLPTTALLSDPSPPLDALLLGFRLHSQGILAHTALALTSMAADPSGGEISPDSSLDPSPALLSHIPPSALLTATGEQLDTLLARLTGEFGSTFTQYLPPLSLPSPDDEDSLAGGDSPEEPIDTTDLKDSPDFIWGKRPYALAAIANPQHSTPDWIFISQLSPVASDMFGPQLNTLAQARGFNVGPLQLTNQPVTAWTTLSTLSPTADVITLKVDVQGLLAEVDGVGILATSAQAMNQALQAPDHSMVDNPLFQSAIAPISNSRHNTPSNSPTNTPQGTLYIDWPTLQPILESQVPAIQWLSRWGKPWLSHVKSLAISSRDSRNVLRQGDMFIQLSE